jgi:pSer/pThr/pTyr-binding forkhead associated (FHA) protein
LADLLVGQTAELTPSPQISLDLNAFSLSADRGFPSAMEVYTYAVGPVASDAVVSLLEKINAESSADRFSAQLAVWSTSMNAPLNQIAALPGISLAPDDLDEARRLLGQATSVVTPGGDTGSSSAPGDSASWIVLVLILFVALPLGAAAFLGQREIRRKRLLAQATSSPNSTRPSPASGQQRPVQPPSPVVSLVSEATRHQVQAGARLIGVTGPLKGTTFELQSLCLISREPIAWVSIQDLAISAPHAAFDLSQSPHRVKDLKSKNGVKVGEVRLEDRFVELAPDQEVTIGGLGLVVSPHQLRVVRGPIEGKTFAVPDTLVVVSREIMPVIEVGPADRSISDAHALFYAEEGRLYVKDLNSSRGTVVNQRRITDATELKSGDRLMLGASEFSVQVNLTPDEVLPRSFGSYTLISLLGEGGMARVYLAHNPRKTLVAIKVPLNSNRRFIERFESEADILKRLDHPHIVKVHETGLIDRQLFVAEQYIDGCALPDLFRVIDRLRPGTAVAIGRQIAEALGYAHAHNVLYHRDVKPSNILLDRRGQAYLTDFGIAIAYEGADETLPSEVFGSARYMSPEQADPRNLGPINHRTDIYSLGIVLYEMLSGGVPFDAETSMAVLKMQVSDPPPPLRDRCPDVSPPLEQIVMKCLEKSPARRYQAAQELVSALPTDLPEDDLPALIARVKAR